jgi:type IV secretory pathway TrbD component
MTTWYWIATVYCVVMWLVGPMIMLKGVKENGCTLEREEKEKEKEKR